MAPITRENMAYVRLSTPREDTGIAENTGRASENEQLPLKQGN